MATIFQRVSLIIRSNINELLEKFEDPEKIIDQCIIDAKKEYKEMLVETSKVKGNLAIEKKKLDELKKSSDSWNEIAEKAMLADNEEDARKALQKAAEDTKRLTTQIEIVEKCEDATAKATQALNSFSDQINVMEVKKGELKSKAIAARSQEKANSLKSRNIAGSLNTFNDMAEKIDANVARQEALAELTGAEAEADADLKAKYSAPNVENDLAELKKRLGK